MNDKQLQGYNKDINTQLDILEKIIMKNEQLKTVLNRAEALGLSEYYIGAGCITQTVWNYLSDNPLEQGIKDIDFVYFDDKNMDEQSENVVVEKINELYNDLGVEIDVKNEARVHLWYEKHFGYSIKPYTSLEAAINTWPTTATSVGIRKNSDGSLKVYAPYGLNDMFGKIVRANKKQITKEIYENKISSWLKKWPDLNVITWEENNSSAKLNLNSLYICVKDMDRAIAFYEKFLEIPVYIKDEVFSIFVINGFRFCLFNYQKVNEKVSFGDNCLPSFEVPDIEKLIEKLKKLNAEIVFPLTKINENWVLEFKDSEGNDIEVYSKIAN